MEDTTRSQPAKLRGKGFIAALLISTGSLGLLVCSACLSMIYAYGSLDRPTYEEIILATLTTPTFQEFAGATSTPSPPQEPSIQTYSTAIALYIESHDYYDQALNETSYQAGVDEIEQARRAIDQAVALYPTNGDYYHHRYNVYRYLASLHEVRADFEYYATISLENLRLSVALGTTNEYADRSIPLTLFSLGRCDEGMEILSQINAARGASAPPSPSLMNIEAHGYLCLGQLETALEYVDRGLVIDEVPEREWLRAMILYQLGRYDDALDQLNELIQEKPYYSGQRYYLRALIYYEKGMPDLAEQDLWMGEANNWGRGGLRTYLLGRMALDSGDQQAAIEYLQNSLATLQWFYRTTLFADVERLLESLGAEPLPEAHSAWIAVTPIPTLQATPTAIVTAPSAEPPSGSLPTPPAPLVFTMENGTGRLVYPTFYYPIILLQPANPVAIQSVQSLTLNLLSDSEQGATIFRVFIWNPATGEWVMFSPTWGANPIENPSRFVGADGKIYIYVRYPGDKSGVIDNIWVTLSAKAEDGSDIFIDLNE